nr:hypothetical protein [Psychromonas sp. RZ22]
MYRTARQLFKRSRGSLGSCQLCKNLRLAGSMLDFIALAVSCVS